VIRTVIGLATIVLAGVFHPVQAQTPDKPIVVIVTTKGCEPSEVTVPAGTVTFQIVNRSARALEWEILKGVMIVDERENIAPGFRQKMTTDLPAGDYEMTCGLLSNPRGKLIAVNGDGSRTAASRLPTPSELIGTIAEFRVWQVRTMSALASDAGACREGDTADMETRRKAVLLNAIRLLAIDHKVNARVHAAIASASMASEGGQGGACERMARAVGSLAEAAAVLSVSPVDLLTGAARSLEPAGSAEVSYLSMTFDGAARIGGLFQPLLLQADRAAGERLARVIAQGRQASESKDPVALAAAAAALAAELTGAPGRLGL
jgi:hypothetical protein